MHQNFDEWRRAIEDLIPGAAIEVTHGTEPEGELIIFTGHVVNGGRVEKADEI